MSAAVSAPSPISGLSAAAAAAAARISARAIASPTRSCAAVARARQFAVYLQHVALGASLSACARDFARDRATVRHACAVIEDLRDDPAFDQCAARLEKALAAQNAMVAGLIADAKGDPQ